MASQHHRFNIYYDHFPKYLNFRSSAATFYQKRREEIGGAPAGIPQISELHGDFPLHCLIDAAIQKWSSQRLFGVTQDGRLA